MPRKFLRRWIPTPDKDKDYKYLGFLAPMLRDPNLFHLNRHSVSVAFFAGIFCAFLPVPGQSVFAILMALLFRCNMPISVALIWISNPLTMAPFIFITFELGRWLLNSPPMVFNLELSWQWFQTQGQTIIAPLLVGSLVCGLVFGALGYLTIHQLWRWHVVKNWENRAKRRRETQNGE
jgi:uncharacterized protein